MPPVAAPAPLHRFAEEELALDYVFWGTQEPCYTEAVLPYLRELQ